MKVLSIDLDYIMKPCIEIYHGLHWDENPMSRWENFYERSDFKEHDFYIDQANLLFCYEIFMKALSNCDNVSFGFEHDEILYQLRHENKLDIINIDHHDDIFGEDFDGELELEYRGLRDNNRVNEGNWVAWLKLKDKLKSYTWIHNENSRNLMQHNKANVDLLGADIYSCLLKQEYKFEDYNFDYIFVCLSPQYMPKAHWHYFTMFIMAYETFTGKKVDYKSFSHRKFEYEIRHNQVTDEILHKRSNGG